jgi:hypothetical protein
MEQSIWTGISAGATETRVLAMAGPSTTILKARLSRDPSHPRALATLLEAIALWEGSRVRAALCADDEQISRDSSLYHAAFDFGGPLYSVDWVPGLLARRRRRRDVSGMGPFADLRQLLLFEVAR